MKIPRNSAENAFPFRRLQQPGRARFLPRLKRQALKLPADWISCLGLGSDKSMDTFVCMSYFHKSHGGYAEHTGLWTGPRSETEAVRIPAPSDAVTLMTLHATKGLGFPVVILYGLRQGILPLKTGREL